MPGAVHRVESIKQNKENKSTMKASSKKVKSKQEKNPEAVSAADSSTSKSNAIANTQSESATNALAALSNVGHILKAGEVRSEDVNIEENVQFADMYLNEEVLAGLHSSGFFRPSPVQLQAIPTGRCGLDLIVQAKSGTGKTCVFTVLALEMVVTAATTTQAVVVAPTREIAVQIASVMTSVGRHMKGLKVATFIGGTSMDRPGVCHIAVGTPGRLHHVFSSGILSSQNVRLLVLDEADQLLDSFRSVLQQILAAMPHSKQIVCASATYTPSLQELAKRIMRSPVHVTLSSKQLLAVTQYVHQLPYSDSPNLAFRAKLLHLKGILGSAMFNQCLIFTNSILKAESVCDSLRGDGWPVACLCGGQTQEQRLKALDDLVNHKCRVLVATDLAARGLDSPHVSLVVSLEPPPHPHTYLHRVGRAGRFGSSGRSVVIASEGDDWLHVRAIATVLDLSLIVLPEPSLENLDKWDQLLPHLTTEQLQLWTATTSHRLTYSSSTNKAKDELEIWKMKGTVVTKEENTKGIKEASEESVNLSIDAVVSDNSNSDVMRDKDAASMEKVSITHQVETQLETAELSDALVLNEASSKDKSYLMNRQVQILQDHQKAELSHSHCVREVQDLLSCPRAVETSVDAAVPTSDIDLDPAGVAQLHRCLASAEHNRLQETVALDEMWSRSSVTATVALQTLMAGGDAGALVLQLDTDVRQQAQALPRAKAQPESLSDAKQEDDFSYHMKALKEEKKVQKNSDAVDKSDDAARKSKEKNKKITNSEKYHIKKNSVTHKTIPINHLEDYEGDNDYDEDQYYYNYDEDEYHWHGDRDEYGDPIVAPAHHPGTFYDESTHDGREYYQPESRGFSQQLGRPGPSKPKSRKHRPTGTRTSTGPVNDVHRNAGYGRSHREKEFNPVVLLDRNLSSEGKKDVKVKSKNSPKQAERKKTRSSDSSGFRIYNDCNSSSERPGSASHQHARPCCAYPDCSEPVASSQDSDLSQDGDQQQYCSCSECYYHYTRGNDRYDYNERDYYSHGNERDYYSHGNERDYYYYHGNERNYYYGDEHYEDDAFSGCGNEYCEECSGDRYHNDWREQGYHCHCCCGRRTCHYDTSYQGSLNKFALMDYYVRALGRTSALVAQHHQQMVEQVAAERACAKRRQYKHGFRSRGQQQGSCAAAADSRHSSESHGARRRQVRKPKK